MIPVISEPVEIFVTVPKLDNDIFPLAVVTDLRNAEPDAGVVLFPIPNCPVAFAPVTNNPVLVEFTTTKCVAVQPNKFL